MMFETIITAIAIIIGAIIQAKVGLPFPFWKKSQLKVFDMPKDNSLNIDFYTYFTEKIRSAKKSIYITGDGPNMIFSDDKGKNIADDYINAYRYALNRNVSIVRIEFGNEFHPKWKKMVKELIQDFPDLFQFYFLKEKTNTQIVSLCTIDHELKSGNVVEIMLPIEGMQGTKKKKLAGPVIFLHNSQRTAIDITRELVEIIKRDECVERINSVEKLERISKE